LFAVTTTSNDCKCVRRDWSSHELL
jgi:hypothetical protein